MLTEIEQKVLYKVLKEEPFSELETELMNRMLYLDEEIRHEIYPPGSLWIKNA